jgi:hypothetical protein
MENDKYFTPDIEDLRVGYECDLLGSKIVIEDRHDLDLSFDHPLRTPYLTKEQIEAEGWKETISHGVFEKGRISISISLE